jgi:hypothetical protein
MTGMQSCLQCRSGAHRDAGGRLLLGRQLRRRGVDRLLQGLAGIAKHAVVLQGRWCLLHLSERPGLSDTAHTGPS